LKFDADEFDVLSLHFEPDTLALLDTTGWSSIIDGYQNYPPSFQRVIRFLVPCLVHHFFNGDLTELFHADHPLFAQRFFTEPTLLNSLKDKVIFEFAHCPYTEMYASGVPAFITISREVRNFRQYYDSTCRTTDPRIDAMRSEFDSKMDSLPALVCDLLLSKVRIEGQVPITLSDIRSAVNDMLGLELSTIRNDLHNIGGIVARMDSRSLQESSNERLLQDNLGEISARGEVHKWPGDARFHMVPHGFKWPSFTTNTMWNLWFLGDSSKKICAFRFINAKTDLVTPACKTNRSRTSKVIGKMVQIAIDASKICRTRDININNIQYIYDFAYPILLQKIYPSGELSQRCHDININTLSNKMVKQ
jgi:hypothetical protein